MMNDDYYLVYGDRVRIKGTDIIATIDGIQFDGQVTLYSLSCDDNLYLASELEKL